MGKYHKVIIDDQKFKMRDVPIDPFNKKVRVASIKLKEKILEKIEVKENLLFLRYVNNRIHFFVDEHYLELTDKELEEYINKNFYSIKNSIEI